MQEIIPQLEKLSSEKKILLKYKSNETDLAQMAKQLVSYDF
jgi:hypothetical protein